MSVWRVEMEMAFSTEDELISFVNIIEGIKTKALNLDFSPIPTQTICRYHECFHDENPPKPCVNYKFINFKDPTITIQRKEDGTEVKADLIVKTISADVLTAGVVSVDPIIKESI